MRKNISTLIFKRKRYIIVAAFLLNLIFIELSFSCAEGLFVVPGMSETGFLQHEKEALTGKGIRRFSLCADNHSGYMVCLKIK